ncbi:hypothetical protein ACFYRN_45090 [Streptomyces sp. NPDC005227]|uniref:hypothetical protein n=1 Tax=Streptomyces sp. NPDC005227 TaxID=3364707 RepID=UPI00367A6232
MDPQIAELARSAGTTMVTLMATQAWEATRDGLVGLWQRLQPARAEAVRGELEASRAELLLAREAGDNESEAELATEWQGRIRRLLLAHPEVAVDLQSLLDELAPQLPQQPAVVEIRQRAEASGSGRVYQAGRDQHITER